MKGSRVNLTVGLGLGFTSTVSVKGSRVKGLGFTSLRCRARVIHLTVGLGLGLGFTSLHSRVRVKG